MGNNTDGLVGVDVDATYTGTTTNGVDAPLALGTTVRGTDGTVYVLCQAAEAISTTTKEPYALGIDEAFQASKLTKTLAIAGYRIGFAPEVAVADNDFFWARTAGVFDIRVAASCAADITLFTTAVAGRLDDTSGGSHVAVYGVVITTAASASSSASNTVREAIVTNLLVTEV